MVRHLMLVAALMLLAAPSPPRTTTSCPTGSTSTFTEAVHESACGIGSFYSDERCTVMWFDCMNDTYFDAGGSILSTTGASIWNLGSDANAYILKTP